MSRVFHAFASVHCCLDVTCWERADIGDVYCIFVIFPCGILGQVWYLIVSIPDLCRLSYFNGLGSFSWLGGFGCFRGLCFEVLQLTG